mmetsp:Transcript_718/g.483  ORF Transcript_718/g.483 Transcript_718/m.483 type:complete len:80 (+) Transcript_718:69-308(+)
MKFNLSSALLLVSSASAFVVTPNGSASRSKSISTSSLFGTPGMDLSGNSWKPDSDKMGSTDTGDYFPEGYDPNAAPGFT